MSQKYKWLISRGACLVLAVSLAAAARAEDWPQWRGASRDGHVSWLPQAMPALKVLWRQPVAGTCEGGIAVVDGLLVMADHDGKHDDYGCYAAADGKPVWKRTFPNDREMDYGAGPRATPLIHRAKVYVLSAFGEFYCLELKSGKTVWQKDFVEDFGANRVPRWGYCGSPLVADGKLIVNPGGKASLVALSPDTGQVIWQGSGGRANYSSFIAGTFGGVAQLVGYDARSLGGWELATGKRLWTIEVDSSGGYIVPTPVAVGDKLFVTDQSNWSRLFAFDSGGLIRQEPLASNDELSPEVPTPVAAGELIVGQATRLVCLDAADGLKTLWIEEEQEALRSDCHLIVCKDHALAFNREGELVLFRFDRQGIKVLGKQALCKKTLMHPTLAGSRLYVRDSEFLYCYELAAASAPPGDR